MNDRLALELGRALLRAVIAEERAAQLQARLDAADQAEPSEPSEAATP